MIELDQSYFKLLKIFVVSPKEPMQHFPSLIITLIKSILIISIIIILDVFHVSGVANSVAHDKGNES